MNQPQRSPPKIPPHQEKPKGTISLLFDLMGALIKGLLVALVVSVLIELVGIAAKWWPGHHAQTLLTTERGYIANIDAMPLMALTPSSMSLEVESQFNQRVSSVQSYGDTFSVYLLAAINTAKLLLLRLVVCLFSLPGYLVVGLAALIDGLVQRDIRKYTGGHESSYVFHKAKRWVVPGIVGTISIYLMMPWAVYPAVIFAPSMALFGFALYVTASQFKKYL